jgi:hypothetical protein
MLLKPLKAAAVLAALTLAGTAWGAMSSNLIVGGDFESLSAIKVWDSPRTQAEIIAGSMPVRAWQFHPGGIAAEATPEYSVGQSFTDFGKWIGAWGISTNDDPRALYNQTGENGAPNNVSTVAGNSFLEGAYFRSWAAQVVKAPANHAAGAATINFDYYFNQWTPPSPPSGNDANSIFHVWIGGINDEDLPTWADRAGPVWGGAVDGDPEASTGTWDLNPLWSSPNFDSQPWGWEGIGSDQPAVGSQGQLWHSLSSTFPTSVSFTIPQTYDNYYISVWQSVYSEGHEYYWLHNNRVVDQLAVAIDNMDLRVSVADEYCWDPWELPNGLWISPFVEAITTSNYQAKFDFNLDAAVNALDISAFIYCLTSGTCGSCGPAGIACGTVPEPTSAVAMLALLALAGLHRRH